MLRFILQRLALIVLVITSIIFAVSLGMLMVERNAIASPKRASGN